MGIIKRVKKLPFEILKANCDNCKNNNFNFYVSEDDKKLYFECVNCKAKYKLEKKLLKGEK